MVAPESVIVQLGRRTIGGRCNGARSVGAADDLGREMVDRHDGRYTAFLSARRQRRISAHSHSLSFAVIDFAAFFVRNGSSRARSCYAAASVHGREGENMRKTRDYDAELRALATRPRRSRRRRSSSSASWSRPPGPMRSISIRWRARCSPPWNRPARKKRRRGARRAFRLLSAARAKGSRIGTRGDRQGGEPGWRRRRVEAARAAPIREDGSWPAANAPAIS
jgi:hypothetical protein